MPKDLTYYVITDTHLGHAQMVNYRSRPTNHSEIILAELEKIPAGVVLVHLGDVCIGKDAYWHSEYLQATKHCAKRILILGNHDKKSYNWYYAAGWDFVCESMIIKHLGKTILFSHIPKEIPNDVDLNIHGHFHNSQHHNWEPELMAIYGDRHKLLAIENTDYKAVSLTLLTNNFNA